MKLLTAATVLSVVFSAAAYAETNVPTADTIRDAMANPQLQRDPDLEHSGYYNRRKYYIPNNASTEQINAAIRFLGRPEYEQIGHSRVLDRDNSDVTRSQITIKRH